MGVYGPVGLQGREMIFFVILHGQLGLVWPPVHLVCVLLQAFQSPSQICERVSRVEFGAWSLGSGIVDRKLYLPYLSPPLPPLKG